MSNDAPKLPQEGGSFTVDPSSGQFVREPVESNEASPPPATKKDKR